MVLGRKYWIKRGRRGLKVVDFTVIVLGIGDEYGLFRFEAFSDGIGITKKKILSKMTSLLTITKKRCVSFAKQGLTNGKNELRGSFDLLGFHCQRK